MNDSAFPHDVFLSHSSKDKAVVRPLAERLRKDGLKVWFDEWVLKPGDSIPAKIEEGLERSQSAFQPLAFPQRPHQRLPGAIRPTGGPNQVSIRQERSCGL